VIAKAVADMRQPRAESRELGGRFSRRDIALLLGFFRMALHDRFLGSTLGTIWAAANPLLLLAIFTFVFGFVLKARFPGAETSLQYVTWLVSGYGPWLAMTETLSSSTSSIVSNSGLVKNLAFKTELLTIANGLLGVVPLAVTSVYLIALLIVQGTAPSWPWLAVIIAIPLQFLFTIGIGLMLAGINVFVRDIALALPNLLIIILFASPIFYPVDAFPGVLRAVSYFNPFFLITEAYRQPLLHGRMPPAWLLGYLSAVSIATFVAGLALFRRLKGYFDARL
jgi:lipopolysaccharide transport system permease protein